MWSLGVVTFMMLVGGNPFPQSDRKDARAITCAGLTSVHAVHLSDLSAEVVTLIQWMLAPQQHQRAVMDQVCSHKYVLGLVKEVPACTKLEVEEAAAAEAVQHSPRWKGARHKWAQVRDVHRAVFSLRRTFNKSAMKTSTGRQRSNTAARAPAEVSMLLTDDEMEVFIRSTKDSIDKCYSGRKKLVSNENCDVFTATAKTVKRSDRTTPAKAGEKVVIKVVECDPYDIGKKQELLQEVRISASLGSHPFVVTFVEAFFCGDECSTVMSFAKGGELFDRIQKHGVYSEREAQLAFKRVANAVFHVHSHGVIHRDIKPENLLLERSDDPTSVLLSDFDMSIEDSAPANDKFGLIGTAGKQPNWNCFCLRCCASGYTAPELGSMNYSYPVQPTVLNDQLLELCVTCGRWIYGVWVSYCGSCSLEATRGQYTTTRLLACKASLSGRNGTASPRWRLN